MKKGIKEEEKRYKKSPNFDFDKGYKKGYKKGYEDRENEEPLRFKEN